MKCKNCGKELESNDEFCNECGQSVKETNAAKNEEKMKNGMKKDTFLCIISIIMYIGGPVLAKLFTTLKDYSSVFGFLSRVATLLPFFAFALVIYTKVKYRDSKFATILLIIYISLFVLAIIALILLIIACVEMLKGCGNMDWDSCKTMGYIINSLF